MVIMIDGKPQYDGLCIKCTCPEKGDDWCEHCTDNEQSPQAAPEAGSECMNLLSRLELLVDEWEENNNRVNKYQGMNFPNEKPSYAREGAVWLTCANTLRQIIAARKSI